MRWLKRLGGLALTMGSLCVIWLCVVNRAACAHPEGAGGIGVPIDHPIIAVGTLMDIVLGLAFAVLALAGLLIAIRANGDP